MAESINIDVVYALPDMQQVVHLVLPFDSHVQQALEASGLLETHALDISNCKVGIFGKQVKPDTALRDRDRIEIYRPLIADPKAVRKARAAEGKSMKKGRRGPETRA